MAVPDPKTNVPMIGTNLYINNLRKVEVLRVEFVIRSPTINQEASWHQVLRITEQKQPVLAVRFSQIHNYLWKFGTMPFGHVV
jgi:hypothetical protein